VKLFCEGTQKGKETKQKRNFAVNFSMEINPKEIPVPQLHGYLLGAIGPRPIAFASTMDAKGNPNLAPFSFFNVFSANPPVLIFSPARSGRTNTQKHTYENIREVPEVVINVVTHAMVHQMSLASTEYPKGINEFAKAGFTPLPSSVVRPLRVKESPVQFECKVNQVIELGNSGGAGNLILCEVIKIHIDDEVLNAKGAIDQQKIDLVARMGGNWYCRAHGDALFEVDKPLTTLGIGVDAIPYSIRNSTVLSGNNLGQLGNVEHLPTEEEVHAYIHQEDVARILQEGKNNVEAVHVYAKKLLNEQRVKEAWMILLAIKN
jgi:flavin reductase (DIM6/NTAB) family NADH-FMN oxidoreductase RutF